MNPPARDKSDGRCNLHPIERPWLSTSKRISHAITTGRYKYRDALPPDFAEKVKELMHNEDLLSAREETAILTEIVSEACNRLRAMGDRQTGGESGGLLEYLRELATDVKANQRAIQAAHDLGDSDGKAKAQGDWVESIDRLCNAIDRGAHREQVKAEMVQSIKDREEIAEYERRYLKFAGATITNAQAEQFRQRVAFIALTHLEWLRDKWDGLASTIDKLQRAALSGDAAKVEDLRSDLLPALASFDDRVRNSQSLLAKDYAELVGVSDLVELMPPEATEGGE